MGSLVKKRVEAPCPGPSHIYTSGTADLPTTTTAAAAMSINIPSSIEK